MGVFDKLTFWKKKDDFDFDKFADKDMMGAPFNENEGFEQDNLGLGEKSPFPEEVTQQAVEQQTAEPFASPTSKPRFTPLSSQQPAYREITPTSPNRDWELINSKLDTLKAILTSLDQRLERLERSSTLEKKERLW